MEDLRAYSGYPKSSESYANKKKEAFRISSRWYSLSQSITDQGHEKIYSVRKTEPKVY